MSQCEFFQSEIEYLGDLVSGKGFSTIQQKVKAITELSTHYITSLKLRHIIGLIGYYQEILSNI